MRAFALVTAALAATGCQAAAKSPAPFSLGIVARSSGDSASASTPQIERVLREAASKGDVALLESANNNDDVGRLELLTIQNYATVIAFGPDMAPAVAHIAQTSPKRQFVIIDGYADGPNINSVAIADARPAFLAGVLTALATRDRRVALVHSVGTQRGPQVESGFAAGVRQIDPSIGVTVIALDDPAGAPAAVGRALGAGADTLTIAVAGSDGARAFAAAGRHPRAVTYGFDAPGALAGVPDGLVIAALIGAEQAAAQKVPSGGSVVGPAEGMRLTLRSGAKTLPASARARYARIAAALEDGAIEAPVDAAALRRFKPNGL